MNLKNMIPKPPMHKESNVIQVRIKETRPEPTREEFSVEHHTKSESSRDKLIDDLMAPAERPSDPEFLFVDILTNETNVKGLEFLMADHGVSTFMYKGDIHDIRKIEQIVAGRTFHIRLPHETFSYNLARRTSK